MDGKIYGIRDKSENKIYIGQTTKTLNERFYQHIYSYTSPSNKKTLISSVIREKGRENFEIFSIEDKIESREELNNKECYYIKKYNSLYPNGYNVSPGANKYRRKPKLQEEDIEKAVRMYKNGKSTRDIAREFGVDHVTVLYHLKKVGCEIRKRNCNLPDHSSVLTKDIMNEYYIEKKMRIKDIAEKFNVSVSAVNRAKRRYNLSR